MRSTAILASCIWSRYNPIPTFSERRTDMDNVFLLALVFFPAALIVAALLNMLVWWSFSWSELVFDYLAGVAIGLSFYFATQPDAGGAAKFFLVWSQGIFGVLHIVGAITDRAMLFYASAGTMVGATLVAALLDRAAVAIGKEQSLWGGLFSILVFPLKAPFSLLTTGIGLLFFLVGIFRSIGENGRVGFLAGVLYVEWNTSTDSSSATTVGGVVQIWNGKFEALIEHELYHSRQYIYLHDWLIPAWLLGGIWGLISSAATGSFALRCFQAAKHDKEVGNPIERAAYGISGYSNC